MDMKCDGLSDEQKISVILNTRDGLSDNQWDRIKDMLPGREGTPGATAKDNRQFVEGVLWVLHSGSFWRQIPDRYGNWKNIHRRFSRWAESGVWERLFLELSKKRDNSEISIDSTAVKVNLSGHGARGKDKRKQAIGKTVGGWTTKIHLTTERRGRPIRVVLTPGQDHDVTQAMPLISGLVGGRVLADGAYDKDALVEHIESQGGNADIPPRCSRREKRYYDKEAYKRRNRIERTIGRLKSFRRVSTRYEKTSRNYLAMVHLACTMLWLADEESWS